MSNKIRVCVVMDKDTHDKVKKLAKSEHRSVSNLISVLIDKEYEKG